jgi:hypothetical protein
VLCITEHWSNYQKLRVMNVDYFTVAVAFCSCSSNHGGVQSRWREQVPQICRLILQGCMAPHP